MHSIVMDPSIKYIGADDLDLRLFENQYPTPKGMSYNSYLIRAGKIAVADTIDVRCSDQWLAHLDEELGTEQPDYLIVHHMEPDHSANIEVFMERYPKAVLVATAKAIAMLPNFFGGHRWPDRVLAVKENDTLDLDGLTLRFIMAPMIHWPEVMVTYIPELKTLLSADAFGKFGAIEFDDDWVSEARRYYINIVGKYGAQVQTLLRKLSSLDIQRIMPLHGPVLEEPLSRYIGLYDTWSSYRPETVGVLVAYASVYGGTAACAALLADILRRRGVETVLFDLCRGDMSEAVGQAFRMSRMVLAAVTYDGGVFTPMVDFINHLAVKTYRGRKVGFIENGSWAPVAARMMMKQMAPMRDIEFVTPQVTIHSRMNESTLQQLEALADAMLA